MLFTLLDSSLLTMKCFYFIAFLISELGVDSTTDASSSVVCMHGPHHNSRPKLRDETTGGFKRRKNASDGDYYGHYAQQYCLFRNVCWHPKHGVLFVLGRESSISNISSTTTTTSIHSDGGRSEQHGGWVRGPWPITNVSASTADHQGLPVDVVTVDRETLTRVVESARDVRRLGRAILLHRYLPSNFMHVLHDDVLPAFALVEQLRASRPLQQQQPPPMTTTTSSYTTAGDGQHDFVSLLLVDDRRHTFDDMYKLVGVPVFYSEASQVTCVDRLYVGLPRTTLWYQYGTRVAQGRVQGTDVAILERFRLQSGVLSDAPWIPHRFETDEREARSKDHLYAARPRGASGRTRTCTLIIRDANRKILNVDEVKQILQSEGNCHVQVISSLRRASLSELRQLIVNTDLLVAMHGAELGLAIFLRRGSAVLEMFPYAVPPENYTPYRTLCGLLGIAYAPWSNVVRENSVGHTEYGLSGLSADDVARVLSLDRVEPHVCCDNPAWLYRIYQDTLVEPVSFRTSLAVVTSNAWKLRQCERGLFLDLIAGLTPNVRNDEQASNTVAKKSSVLSQAQSDWAAFWQHLDSVDGGRQAIAYPSRILKPSCSRYVSDHIRIRWQEPLNWVSMRPTDRWYEVLSQCSSEPNGTSAAKLFRTRKQFIEIVCAGNLRAWVKLEGGTDLPNPVVC